MDALTDAGLGVGFFIPFTQERYFFPWRPVMTASLNPATFWSPKNLEILFNEIAYVWMPLAGVSMVFHLIRQAKKRLF